MFTKGDIVRRALRKLGVASNATLSNVEPESMADALTDLEDMMADWDGQGIRIGYAFSVEPPQPDDDSNLPDWSIKAVSLNLAIIVAPDYLRPASDILLSEADKALETVRIATLIIPKTPRRGDMSRGQGNKNLFPRGRFYQQHSTVIRAENDGSIEGLYQLSPENPALDPEQ